GNAPFTGSFIPQELLAAFNGTFADGLWTLRIEDEFGVDIGSLASWSLDITTTTGSFTFRQPANAVPYFAPAFDPSTLPLIIPGPYVVSTRVGQTYTASLNTPLAIPDAVGTTPGQVTATLTVPPYASAVSGLKVQLGLTHPD